MKFILALLTSLLIAYPQDVSTSKLILADKSTVQKLTIKNKNLTLSLIPSLGAKIISIKDRNGKEYLSRSTLTYKKRSKIKKYSQTEYDGIDECFISMHGKYPLAPFKDKVIKTHGPLIYKEWKWLKEEKGISLEAKLDDWKLTFKRELFLNENSIILHYTLTNHSKFDFYFLYAFQPLFAASKGTKVNWPLMTKIKPAYSSKNFLAKQGKTLNWFEVKNAKNEFLLSAQFVPNSKRYYKYYTVEPLSEATLEHADGRRLKLQWDKKVLPAMAVWSNEGAYGKLNQIGLQPTTSRFEAIAEAFKANESKYVRGNSEFSWKITLTIEPSDK